MCSTIVSKSNICNTSIVSQHLNPLYVSKSMYSCNVRNRNVHMVNSISHHVKPLSVGKSDCFCNVSKPVICESVVTNLSKRACKRSCNISSHKHSGSRSLNVRNTLMTSIYFYELVLSFFVFHHNFCNSNVNNFFKAYVTRNNFSRTKFLNYDSFFIMATIFSIYHTQMFYLVQIVFVLLVSIFINILFIVFLMIYFM